MSLSADLEQTWKELKMLQILQKEYSIDIFDFTKWQ